MHTVWPKGQREKPSVNIYRPQPQASVLGTRVDLRAVMKEVYLWMTLGLLTSGIVATLFAVTGLTAAIFPVLIVAPFVQIGLVWYLSARIQRLEASRATNLFLLFAAVMGVSLSTVFYWGRPDGHLSSPCSPRGAMFGAMSIVGYTTEMDLSRLG